MPLDARDLATWFEEQGEPWLYHELEDPSHIRHVLRDGLRAVEDRWPHGEAHRDRCVYLWADGSVEAAVRIDLRRLDVSLLRVDEGFPAAAPQAFGDRWRAADPPPEHGVGAWADGIADDASPHVLKSLRLGSVAYRGIVPGEAIEINPIAAPRVVAPMFQLFLDQHADLAAVTEATAAARGARDARLSGLADEAASLGLR